MSVLIRQVAIVSTSPQISSDSNADIWLRAVKRRHATWARLEISLPWTHLKGLSKPVGTWPIIIGGQVPPGAGGFHTDNNGQPRHFSASNDVNVLCRAVTNEMLVDPFGSFVPGDLPMPDQGVNPLGGSL